MVAFQPNLSTWNPVKFSANIYLQVKNETVSRGVQINMDLVSNLKALCLVWQVQVNIVDELFLLAFIECVIKQFEPSNHESNIY